MRLIEQREADIAGVASRWERIEPEVVAESWCGIRNGIQDRIGDVVAFQNQRDVAVERQSDRETHKFAQGDEAGLSGYELGELFSIERPKS